MTAKPTSSRIGLAIPWALALLLVLLAGYGAFKFTRLAETRLSSEVQGIGQATAALLDTWLADRRMLLETGGALLASNQSPAVRPGSGVAGDAAGDRGSEVGGGEISLPGFTSITVSAREPAAPDRVFLPIGREDASAAWRVQVRTPLAMPTGQGSIQGELDLTPIREVVERLRFKQLGHAFLIDEQSTIIAHPIGNLVGKSLATEFQGLAGMSSSLQPVQSSIGPRLLAFFPLQSRDSPRWTLVADINRGEAHDLTVYLALTALALPLAVVLAGFGWRRGQ